MDSKRLALISLLLLTGCTSFRHGITTIDFEGYLVPVDSRPGALRLQTERNYDSTLESFVLAKGDPDYIFVVDRNQVKLVYLEANEVATFKRFFSSKSKVSVETKLTPDITARLEQLTQATFANLIQ